MLSTIRDDIWNVLNMQYIYPKSKIRTYSEIPGGGNWKIKGPSHMVEGGLHIGKSPNTHPQTYKLILQVPKDVL